MTASIRAICKLGFSFLLALFLFGCAGMVPVSTPPAQSTPAPPSSATTTQEVIYAQSDDQPMIFAFRINADDGSLTPISGSPFPVPVSVRRIEVMSNQHFLLANRIGGLPDTPVGIYAIPIHADGSLAPVGETPSLAQALTVVSSSQEGFFYATGVMPAAFTLHQFDDKTGTFSAPVKTFPCVNVFDFQCSIVLGVAPNGDILWASGTRCDRETCETKLTPFAIDGSGSVIMPTINRVAEVPLAADPVILKQGIAFVGFADSFPASDVELWSSDGILIQECGKNVSPACAQPSSIAVDQGEHFLFVGGLDGNLWSMPFGGASGFLPDKALSLSTQIRLDNMIVNRTGKFLYVLDNLSNTLTGYHIDPQAGALSPIHGATMDLSFPNAASSGRQNHPLTIAVLPKN